MANRRALEGSLNALLSSPEPSIRWRARVGALGEERSDRAVARLEEEIRASVRVRKIRTHERARHVPGTARNVYYKWQGVHWAFANLADLGYPRGDPGLNPVRDRVVGFWLGPRYYQEFEANTAAPSYGRTGVARMNGRYRRCASQQGNALYAMARLGLDDGRGAELRERLVHWQWPDGGWNCDRDPSADSSSFMETLLPMRGLAELGRTARDPAAREAARLAAEVFLSRRMFRRRSDGRVMAVDFLRLHYPVYWHYDVLAGLRGIGEVGLLKDPRAAEALDWLESRQLEEGGWPADARYYRVSPEFRPSAEFVDWGPVSGRRMNPWVTTDALRVLREAGRFGG